MFISRKNHLQPKHSRTSSLCAFDPNQNIDPGYTKLPSESQKERQNLVQYVTSYESFEKRLERNGSDADVMFP